MGICQKRTMNELAKLLLQLDDGETVEFGLGYDGDEKNDTFVETEDVSEWYFARKMSIPEYCSRFILIDYAGGECACAIPLNNYQPYTDGDDKWIVPMKLWEYFSEYTDCNHVYVSKKKSPV